jgi:hypothetical protein
LLDVSPRDYAAVMAKTKRRSFGKFLRGAVKDVVMPTSVGLGLALGGCGSTDDKPDSRVLDVLPPSDAVVRVDGPVTSSDARLDTPIAIFPPDAAVDRRVDTRPYAVMPPVKDAAREYRDGYAIMPPRDAGADARDTRPEARLYAIMPMPKDAGGDEVTPDAESAMPDATLDAKKPQIIEVGPIYAIMPLAVLPPHG